MGFWGRVGAVRRCIVLLVAISIFGIGSARAEMHSVAKFGNSDTHVSLVLAEGEANGTRLAAIIADHPWPASTPHACRDDAIRNGGGENTDPIGVPNRIAVVFDKQTWPAFDKMWSNQVGTYIDPVEGTGVEMCSAYEAYIKMARPSLMHDPSEIAIVISVTDRYGNHGDVEFSQEYRTAHDQMKDAIKKISDYLNQPSQNQPAQ